jgi:hypothetical protein
VPANEVGAASGISNMARYVGGAVTTAVAAGIYASVSATRTATGGAPAAALAAGFGWASIALAIFSAAGIVLSVRAARRTGPPSIAGYAAAAASTSHTVPVTPRT